MVKYNKSTIYKICCKDPNVTEEYVGSTTNFSRRKYEHKSNCHNENSENYNRQVYICIRENGNFENWDMVEVEKYEATDKQDLHKRERYWVETLKSSLNSYIPTQTREEHHQANKERLNAISRQYHEDNKEAIVAQKKIYYEANKERLNATYKQYRQENKEAIAVWQKKHREVNGDIVNAKRRVNVTCECGKIITKGSLSAHKKSARHLKLMELIK